MWELDDALAVGYYFNKTTE